MRKDYRLTGPDEIAHPDPVDFWTRIWEQHTIQTSREQIAKQVEASEEYRLVAPYVDEIRKLGSSVLDGGCGIGAWVVYLQSRGIETVGVDISASTVEKLSSLFPKCTWRVNDITALDAPAKSFAAELSWGTFEHFEIGVEPPLREARRVLVDHGLLFFTVPYDNMRMVIQHAGRPATRTPPSSEPHTFYQWRFNRKEIAFEVERCGFEVLQIKPIHTVEGVRRLLMSVIGAARMPLARELSARVLARALPSIWLGHMLMVVARKRAAEVRQRDRLDAL